MAEVRNLKDALVDEVRDLYDAEQQLVKALPAMATRATDGDLQDALASHLAETMTHVSRLERVFELLGETASAKHCAALADIIDEGTHLVDSQSEGPGLDACIIGIAQRAEHYEIAGYGMSAAWAESLGRLEIVDLLAETLQEEKSADERLMALAGAGMNRSAMADSEKVSINPG